jgi:hypothetical protein
MAMRINEADTHKTTAVNVTDAPSKSAKLHENLVKKNE